MEHASPAHTFAFCELCHGNMRRLFRFGTGFHAGIIPKTLIIRLGFKFIAGARRLKGCGHFAMSLRLSSGLASGTIGKLFFHARDPRAFAMA
ncbi:MAG: hypothetical protein A3H32_02710 [Betaproteobacteria bacterium RIFCSPLOWO2_02_FULL_63_19]|nr:MAG: hypothetical protein A3H32_02710 [Betaproteobacteria bacterium RIFCSPLOWO2_02_FULL_63_19]OGA71396.1 MAG: hypothetical protein A3G81_30520 [Betaproteobacteria bacterium RIFCSPLOWO2_12_FULL_65_14]